MPRTALPELLVLGSINQDIIAHTDRLPVPGETVGNGTLSRYPGGKGANQAVAAARLGADVRLMGAIGDDAAGHGMRAELERAGVDTSLVAVRNSATGTALITVDALGENQIAVCPGANAEVEFDTSDFDGTGVILAQLEVPLAAVVRAAESSTGYFALNAAPAMRLPRALIERCDLIIVNETEYADMPELADARLVAVTYGGEGASLLRHGTQALRIPAKKATVVNSVGAGDSFCAALTLALAAGAEPETALRVAAAVGAAAVSHPASQPPLETWNVYAQELFA